MSLEFHFKSLGKEMRRTAKAKGQSLSLTFGLRRRSAGKWAEQDLYQGSEALDCNRKRGLSTTLSQDVKCIMSVGLMCDLHIGKIFTA